MSNNNIGFGNNANLSKGSGNAFGANSKSTSNSNNKTTNNTSKSFCVPLFLKFATHCMRNYIANNRGKNNYNVNVGTQYGNSNTGDGQHNAGSTYNF